jgi:hypothetical protein
MRPKSKGRVGSLCRAKATSVFSFAAFCHFLLLLLLLLPRWHAQQPETPSA